MRNTLGVTRSNGFGLGLNEERRRLCTFVGTKYLLDCNFVSPMLLAQQGFVYCGQGDWVQCVFCSLTKQDWRQYDDVEQIHRQLSPACPMVTGVECGNIPLSAVYNNSLTRQGASPGDSIPRHQSHERFTVAAATQIKPLTTNSEEPMDESIPPTGANNTNISTPTLSASPHTASNSSTNQMPVQNTTSNQSSFSSSNNQPSQSRAPTNQQPESNQPTTDSNYGGRPTLDQLNIVTARPKRYEYAVRDKRMETFNDWPANHHLAKEQLVNAGLFYPGVEDCGRCFYCGGGMRNWEVGDEPIVEHARWFPKCAFVMQLMGKEFVKAVAHFAVDHEKINLQMVADFLNKDVSALYALLVSEENKETSLRNDSAVKAICDFGYNLDDVLPVAAQLKETMSSTNDFLDIVDLFNELVERGVSHTLRDASHLEWMNPSCNVNEELERLNNLREHTAELRQRALCKVCLDKEVGVIFLECGHMACCTECASAMRNCPVCRIRIKATVRGYMV